MPIYEYVCTKCGRKTEIIQRMADAPLAKCPECGARVKKAFSAPAIQFKGSGWYVNDYGSGATKAAPKSEGGEESRGSSGSSDKESGKSESGAAEKAEKADKAEKAGKADRGEKAEKAEKAGRSERAESSEKKKSSKKRS
jgi:putative FmdB family regulatory protein